MPGQRSQITEQEMDQQRHAYGQIADAATRYQAVLLDVHNYRVDEIGWRGRRS